MDIKPILFNAEMVRAILEGRKTTTRRVMNPQPVGYIRKGYFSDRPKDWVDDVFIPHKPRYSIGDILWVRETWQYAYNLDGNEQIIEDTARYIYAADGDPGFTHWLDSESGELIDHVKWRPSIHMPKAAARIFLRVTDVRIERLQDITEDDVVAEGAEKLITCQHQHGIIESDGTLGDMCWNSPQACKWCHELDPYEESFGRMVWDSTIKKKDLALYGWDANPWVWVYTFKRYEKPEGWPILQSSNEVSHV